MADENRIFASFSKGITALNIKTSSFLETNKLNAYISSVLADISILKAGLGETVYSKWKNGGDYAEDIEKAGSVIKEKESLIEELNLKKRIIEERDRQILGKKAPRETAMLPVENVAQADKLFVCAGCGESFAYKPNFCKKCGQKV